VAVPAYLGLPEFKVTLRAYRCECTNLAIHDWARLCSSFWLDGLSVLCSARR